MKTDKQDNNKREKDRPKPIQYPEPEDDVMQYIMRDSYG